MNNTDYKAQKDALADKIWDALLKKWDEADSNVFEITMKKTGNKILIRASRTGARKVMGHWHSSSVCFEVSGDGIEGIRYFNTLSGLAKTIAYGYIK